MHRLVMKWLERQLFSKCVHGHLVVRLGQHEYVYGQDRHEIPAVMVLDRPFKLFWLYATRGIIGGALAYAKGYFHSPDLGALLFYFARHRDEMGREQNGNRFFRWLYTRMHQKNKNTLENSQYNISAHYDLGNTFYSLWLDETMAYSSGIYTQEGESLVQAQENKFNRVLDQLGDLQGKNILEIGCGWGGLAARAVQRGAQVTGLTLSKEQHRHCVECLPDHAAEIKLQDYRLEDHSYDAIVSIEMFEAVGKEYWDEYFQVLKRNLKEDGKVVLQVITIDEQVAKDYHQGADFIQTFIFPGGLLPAKEDLRALAAKHGFNLLNEFSMGDSYARTLRNWKDRFTEKTHELAKLGYDEYFQRIWTFYLDYCFAGFKHGQIDVVQMTLQPISVKA